MYTKKPLKIYSLIMNTIITAPLARRIAMCNSQFIARPQKDKQQPSTHALTSTANLEKEVV